MVRYIAGSLILVARLIRDRGRQILDQGLRLCVIPNEVRISIKPNSIERAFFDQWKSIIPRLSCYNSHQIPYQKADHVPENLS